ncbi:MAG: flap endonuclease-1 [Candidatus Jordarchaeales archaeon]|nr:flap endonuclease-1 [Candidatus Jordarchaeia archaeon]
MGVNLKELVIAQQVSIKELSGKVIAIDAMNALYQFLATIRQPDGTSLMDRTGRVTSHLSGLFYRTINFLEEGIKPVYVFDGKPPALKMKTVDERRKLREEAKEKWEEALARGEIEEARKFAQAASFITDEMISESKELLEALGVPYVQAPSEGEAQAAYMVKKGDAWCTASQDYDSLLFGAPRLIRNLAISGRRKLPGKKEYVKVEPELISLEDVLRIHGITREQLVAIGILLGTDYNEGVKGVGVKTALKLIKEHGSLKEIIKVKGYVFEASVEEVEKIFLEPEVTDNYTLSWRPPKREKIFKILCDEHDFSQERVSKALDRVEATRKETKQTSIERFF